ncbi:hypothetical protein [Maridesulfovibrio frigidus]|uniref:hypothetical protein n=1 Tax=Maridesulfovibrio frigidus TaxID=340956 RepID=UPI0004E207A4|nr:hypothetical protein [Maridesulfovibrio frigidus]
MAENFSVSFGTKIRCFIVAILGLAFLLPAIGIAIEAFAAPDISADDPLAMLFLALLLGGCGLLLLWVSRDMYRKASLGVKLRNNTDITAVGMANLMNMQDMGNDSDYDGGDFDGDD